MLLSFRRLRRRAIPLVVAVASARTVTLCPAPAAAQARPQDAVVTAFVDVNVIPMDTERVLANQTVLVEGDRITAFGPANTVKVPATAVQVDGRGKYLIPGLADMHAHLAAALTIADAEHALFLFAANGVTTIRNMDHEPVGCFLGPCMLSGADLLQLRARAAAGEIWSPRIYTSGPWYKEAGKWNVSLDSIDSYVRAYKAAGYDFIKPYYEHGALFDSLVAAGRRVGLTFQGHANSDWGLERALTTHKSIEHLTGYAGNAIYRVPLADSVEIPRLVAATARAGVWNCPTLRYPGTQPRNPLEARYGRAERLRQWRASGLTDSMFERREAADSAPPASPMAKRSRLAALARQPVVSRVVRELQRVGAGLLLGTDVPHLPGYSVHHELEALIQAGLTPYEALATGTRNVAQFFGTLDSAGTVAWGKRADLVLLSANPLDDIRNSGQLAGVMIAGRWLPLAAIEQRLAAYYPDSVFPARVPPSSTPAEP